MALRERFNEKWIPHPKRGCWVWIAAIETSGYGSIGGGNGKVVRAHRASWELHVGEVPEGLCVLHSCDNRRCVNPDHLFLGTKKDNSDDMISKGRDRKAPQRGANNGMAKLSQEDIDYIRTSHEGPVALGKKFKVHYRHIWAIRKGLRWH